MHEILRRHTFSITFLTLILGAIFLLPENDSAIARFSGFTMGTTYAVQVTNIPSSSSREILSAEVAELLSALDREVFSTYASESELSRFNRHGVGVPYIASDHLLAVLQLAKEIASDTDGVFDVTVGPLVNLWGFGPGTTVNVDQLPTDDEITALLERVGIDSLTIDAELAQIQKSKNVYVDLSGIAKGYAVDQIAFLLESHNVSNYFIEVGGELKVSGLKPGGEAWVPAIETPQEGPVQVYEVLSNRGETIALAGSGDYRNFFEVDGVRYSHEIDPRTGKPVSHNLAAAFVIDESAARADALATALMILGLDQARALIARENIDAYLIYRVDNSTFDHYVSPGFIPYITN